MSREEAAELMAEVFPDNPGIQKFEVLFDLARDAPGGGHIVEVGTYDGYGTVSLALGARESGRSLPVYAIDPNEECHGWANEPYGPQDRATFLQNILAAEVTEIVRVINLHAQSVVMCWPHAASLLWWDLGQHYEPYIDLILEWSSKIVFGGIMALNETFGDDLGADEVVGLLEERGFELLRVDYGIRILRRIE